MKSRVELEECIAATLQLVCELSAQVGDVKDDHVTFTFHGRRQLSDGRLGIEIHSSKMT